MYDQQAVSVPAACFVKLRCVMPVSSLRCYVAVYTMCNCIMIEHATDLCLSIEHFNGPGRAVGQEYACLCLRTID